MSSTWHTRWMESLKCAQPESSLPAEGMTRLLRPAVLLRGAG
jgi:hypothetical protein